MKVNYYYLFVVAAFVSALFFTSCQSNKITPGQQIALEGFTDLSLALVVSENPQFEAYALAVSEIVRTRDLTPDTLDASLASFLADNVKEEHVVRVSLVFNALRTTYRRYYDAKRIELEPVMVQDAIADQLLNS
jgi:hypothetical protein